MSARDCSASLAHRQSASLLLSIVLGLYDSLNEVISTTFYLSYSMSGRQFCFHLNLHIYLGRLDIDVYLRWQLLWDLDVNYDWLVWHLNIDYDWLIW